MNKKPEFVAVIAVISDKTKKFWEGKRNPACSSNSERTLQALQMPQHSAPVSSLDEYVEQYEVLQNVHQQKKKEKRSNPKSVKQIRQILNFLKKTSNLDRLTVDSAH